MTMNKTRFHIGSSSYSPTALVVRLMDALKWEVPLGYEDETGFHLGVMPEEKEVKWPPTW
jgi:hypothetical protein